MVVFVIITFAPINGSPDSAVQHKQKRYKEGTRKKEE
jgi:hypothetical protein